MGEGFAFAYCVLRLVLRFAFCVWIVGVFNIVSAAYDPQNANLPLERKPELPTS